MDDWEDLTAVGMAWASRRGLPTEEAEDLVQDALLVLVAKEARIECRLGFLLATLKRRLLKLLRERYRTRAALGLGGGFVAEVPTPTPLPAVERLDLGRALARMPPELRRVVILSDYDGVSAHEIADREGISRKDVYHRKRRAIRALRRRLG